MSKILKNNTQSDIEISDTGITITGSGQYEIPATDYPLWAASSDIITYLNDTSPTPSITVNDGSNDLTPASGISLIQGNFPSFIGIQDSGGEKVTVTNNKLDVNANAPSGGFDVNIKGGQFDAAGRFRISNNVSLFEYQAGGYPDYIRYLAKKITGGATITAAENNNPSIKLSVTTASGDLAQLKSRRNIEYNKGNSQLIFLTGKFDQGESGLTQRFGYYNSTHGLFFEQEGTTFKVVRRSNVSGSIVDTPVTQANWNKDTLDGSADANNPSGLQFDPTKQTVFLIDFLWLGSLRVRFYIAIGAQIILVHDMEFSNILSVPYMDSGQCPVKAEIFTTSTISQSRSFYITCTSVKSEGSPIHTGQIRSIDVDNIPIVISGTESIVMGLRLKSSYIKGSLKLMNINIVPTSGNSFIHYKIIYNPTLTSPTWSDMEGIAQYLTNNPSYTGGSELASGYLSMGNKNQISAGIDALLESDIFVGVDCDGNSDSIIIVVDTISGEGDILFSAQYKEYY